MDKYEFLEDLEEISILQTKEVDKMAQAVKAGKIVLTDQDVNGKMLYDKVRYFLHLTSLQADQFLTIPARLVMVINRD